MAGNTERPGFSLAHIGINADSPEEALSIAMLFKTAFGFPVKQGSRSTFAGDIVEVMNEPFLGTKGHIAIGCHDLDAGIQILEERGFKVDMNTAKYKEETLIAVYLQCEFGGFAIHLLKT